jgi:hypothetical protein
MIRSRRSPASTGRLVGRSAITQHGSGKPRQKRRTRETSGSPGTEAPSHHQPLGLWCPKQPRRSSRRWAGQPGGRLALRLTVRLASCGSALRLPPGGGHPTWLALRRSRQSRRFQILRPFHGDGSSSSLAAFRGSERSVPPCGFPGASSGLLASIVSTAWSDAKCNDGSRGGQPRVRAGQSIYPQVAGLEQRVTRRRREHILRR